MFAGRRILFGVVSRLGLMCLMLLAVPSVMVACSKTEGEEENAPEQGEETVEGEVPQGFNEAMLYWHNYARTKPKEFAQKFIKTRIAGADAKNLYQELMSMPVRQPYQLHPELIAYAQGYLDSHPGKWGHSNMGFGYIPGVWGRAESISAGVKNPRDIVIQLLIDKGLAPRYGHRRNILSAEYTHMGAGFVEGGKAYYGFQCMIDYAGIK